MATMLGVVAQQVRCHSHSTPKVPHSQGLCLAQRLAALARQVAVVNPHQLRHGLAYRLWKTATSAARMQILGHSRQTEPLRTCRISVDWMAGVPSLSSSMDPRFDTLRGNVPHKRPKSGRMPGKKHMIRKESSVI
jgi:hypothetical protein